MSTKWGHILSGVAFEFNCIIEKTHILSGRGGLYIYIFADVPSIRCCRTIGFEMSPDAPSACSLSFRRDKPQDPK